MKPELRALVKTLRFEPHNIRNELDETGRYEVGLKREFPLSIRLFHYEGGRFTQGVTWHEQLELFCPLAGEVQVQMGKQRITLGAGDLLVMDNLKLHHVVNSPTLDARVVVVSFLPSLIAPGGVPSCDFEFLLPFFTQNESQAFVLRAPEKATEQAQVYLADLVGEYFADPPAPHRDAACKCALVNLLLVLLRKFQGSPLVLWEFERRRQLGQQFRRLLDELHSKNPRKPSLTEAARMCGMSPARFTRSFREMSGTSYLAYVTGLRMAEASSLLRAGNASIAEIASATGFADQSHFDRRFKTFFGVTPQQFRKNGEPPAIGL